MCRAAWRPRRCSPAGRVTTAVLSEPTATAAIAMAASQGRTLRARSTCKTLERASAAAGRAHGRRRRANQPRSRAPGADPSLGQGVAGREGLGARRAGRRWRTRRKNDGHESSLFIKALPAMNIDYRSALAARRDADRHYRKHQANAPPRVGKGRASAGHRARCRHPPGRLAGRALEVYSFHEENALPNRPDTGILCIESMPGPCQLKPARGFGRFSG